jgi:hypothetical protein
VVGEGRHRGESSALLTTTHGAGRDEHTSHLAPEATGSPLFAGLIPEGLPLGGEVAVAGRDSNEECVVGLEGGRVLEDGDGGVLWGGRASLR